MALKTATDRQKITPDNDRDTMRAKAERVLKAEAHPLDETAQGMFGVPYDQLGPLQIIAVTEAADKTG